MGKKYIYNKEKGIIEEINTKKDINKVHEEYSDYLKAGSLKEILKRVDDDALILIERIKDRYFNDNGWDTFKIRTEPEFENREWIPAFQTIRFYEYKVLLISPHY